MGKWFEGRLRALLAPERVALLHTHGLKGRWRQECALADLQESPADSNWRPAIESMGQLIGQRRWAEMPVDVAVSSAWMHLAVLPNLGTGISGAQMSLLAHGAFENILGEDAGSWEFRYSALDASTLLVAAMPAELMAALGAFARDTGCRLRTVTPLWACAVNQQRKRLARWSGWFVFQERRAVVIALLDKGRWQRVRIRPLPSQADGQGTQTELARALEREFRLEGGESRAVLIADTTGIGSAPLDGPWEASPVPQWLQQWQSLPPACRAAALAGL